MSEHAFTAVRDRMTLMCTCFRGRRYWRWSPTMRVLHKGRAPTARGPCERAATAKYEGFAITVSGRDTIGEIVDVDLERGAPDLERDCRDRSVCSGSFILTLQPAAAD